jgi:hypothetical protein
MDGHPSAFFIVVGFAKFGVLGYDFLAHIGRLNPHDAIRDRDRR